MHPATGSGESWPAKAVRHEWEPCQLNDCLHGFGVTCPSADDEKVQADMGMGIDMFNTAPRFGSQNGDSQFFHEFALQCASTVSPVSTLPPGNSQYLSYGLPTGLCASRTSPFSFIRIPTATSMGAFFSNVIVLCHPISCLSDRRMARSRRNDGKSLSWRYGLSGFFANNPVVSGRVPERLRSYRFLLR